MRGLLRRGVTASLLLAGMLWAGSVSAAEPWVRHTIDRSARGADGVKLADFNSDGRLDIVTGFEEGGISRLFLHPGTQRCREPWPGVTVGPARSVEDAVGVDLDGDGRLEIVSCCEGKTAALFVHQGPPTTDALQDPSAWRTQVLPASREMMQWMYCTPAQIDGRRGVDLLAGGKASNAAVGWWESPEDPRRLEDWRWHSVSPAGWIMSLLAVDMDGDGDLDALLTDRKGPNRGCRWLENPGEHAAEGAAWENHWIGGQGLEVMFLDHADWSGDGVKDIACSTARDGLLLLERQPDGEFREHAVLEAPGDGRIGKGAAVGDLNLDGRADLVWSFEQADDGKSGIVWFQSNDESRAGWTRHDLSGPSGIKFDQVQLVDLDSDGDLDLLTCEERETVDGQRTGLGVIWYENPSR